MSSGEERIPELVDGGLPVVLSQTFRSLIHSRLELGMKGYERSHPKTTIVLFEPDHRDAELFLANTFGYAAARARRARLPADAAHAALCGAACSRSSSRRSACASSMRCSTIRGARSSAGGAVPAQVGTRCGGSKCSTTSTTRSPSAPRPEQPTPAAPSVFLLEGAPPSDRQSPIRGDCVTGRLVAPRSA